MRCRSHLLDKTVEPGDNFFLYVNGGWLKTAEIPAARASTGSFQDLQILSENRLKTIVGDLEKKRGRLTVGGAQAARSL